jgi:hypothetical protein
MWAAVAGAISEAAEGSANALTQLDADRQQRKSNEKTRALNYEMWGENRGRGGHALFPTYTDAEPQLLAQLGRGYWNTGYANNPKSGVRKLGQVVRPYEELADMAGDYAGGIFDGTIKNKLLDAQEPVATQRVAGAVRQGNTTRQALADTLNAIEEAQSQSGITGGDTLSRSQVGFAGLRAAADQESGAIAQANLENAAERQSILNYADVTLPLANVSLPYALAQQDLNLDALPETAYADLAARRLQPLAMFRNAEIPYDISTVDYSRPSVDFGASIASGLENIGGTILDEYLTERVARDMQSGYGTPSYTRRTTPAPSGYGGYGGYNPNSEQYI